METDQVVDFDAAAARYPDHEIVALRFDVPSAEFPGGFSCLLKIPKAKIAPTLGPGGIPPFWRHGETIHVKVAD